MLHVVFPFASVALLLLMVNVLAMTMCLIVNKMTMIGISIRMSKTTLTVSFTVADVTGI